MPTSADVPEPFEAALKFLPGGSLTPLQRVALEEAVRHEIRFSEGADHPRLIRTFETLLVDDPDEPALDGAVVLVMERAARSLRDVLEAGVTPPVSEAMRLLAEICEGLVHMHASGWIHGDLKPGNVLVMDDGSVRLADFGLSRQTEGTHAYVPRVGSSDYLPPEWWTERIGERGVASRTTGDVWAFGVTAHQLLSGTFVRWARVTYRGPQLASGDFHVFGPPGYPDLRSPEHAPLSSAHDFHAGLNQSYPDERLLCGEAWTEGRLLGRPCVVVRAFGDR